MFNRLAEIAGQYLSKGSLVYIEGSLHTRKYTDQQGIERYSTEVRANQMQMLGGQQAQQGHQQQPQQGQQGQYPDASPSTAMQRPPQRTLPQKVDDMPF